MIAQAGWLSSLVAASAGTRCVAGAIVNGTPRSWAGTTEYLVEFLDLHPGRPPSTIWHGATANLAVPKTLWETYGPFVDASSSIKEVGSADTTFTLKAAADGLLDFCPDARVVHMNRTDMKAVMAHQVELGRCAALLARRSPTFPHREVVDAVVGGPARRRRTLDLTVASVTRVACRTRAAHRAPHALCACRALGVG